MEFLKAKGEELKAALSGIRNLQISAKGNAVITLHTKQAPNTPKAKAELIEDGTTINVTDLLLVGAAVCALGAVCSLVSEILD